MRSHSLNLLTANCLQQRFAIAPLQLPQTSFFNEPQRHRGHREREIAPPQPPKQRSHPLNSPNSDRTPSTSQYPFLTNHRDTENTESFAQSRKGAKTQRIALLNSPTSFFNEPRRHEEHEGRREERAIAYLLPISNTEKIQHLLNGIM
jgi:hypothetical protein